MTIAQRFAQIFGAVYLLVGILGFIPIAPFLVGEIPFVIGPFNAFELGLFPVNWLHNIAHIAIGAAGLASYRSPIGARSYALAIGVAYALLTVLGLIPGLSIVFGLLPLFGLDVVLHLLSSLAAFGAYFASPARGGARARA
jgi:hypothetical protein